VQKAHRPARETSWVCMCARAGQGAALRCWQATGAGQAGVSCRHGAAPAGGVARHEILLWTRPVVRAGVPARQDGPPCSPGCSAEQRARWQSGQGLRLPDLVRSCVLGAWVHRRPECAGRSCAPRFDFQPWFCRAGLGCIFSLFLPQFPAPLGAEFPLPLGAALACHIEETVLQRGGAAASAVWQTCLSSFSGARPHTPWRYCPFAGARAAPSTL